MANIVVLITDAIVSFYMLFMSLMSGMGAGTLVLAVPTFWILCRFFVFPFLNPDRSGSPDVDKEKNTKKGGDAK